MPSVSKKQRGAMAAACYGKSTLGIPKLVGCEFSRHDQAKAKSQKSSGTRKKRR